jgi:hypothetical protein
LDTPAQKAAHVAGVAGKLLTTPLLGRFEYWEAFAEALWLRQRVRPRREELRKTQQRTLAEVLRKIENLMSRPEIRVLEDSSAPVRPYGNAGDLTSVQNSAAQSS